MKLFAFPKKYRLRKRIEFEHLKIDGLRLQNNLYIIKYAYNSKGEAARLGITVTKKIGNAVVRNRIKRLIREFFRKNRHKLTQNYDFNVIVKHRIRYHSRAERLDALRMIFDMLISVK
ncbi:Riibonuclease P [Candidatus Magnetomorum sp. HK-1]|nr:Riibonuclease P [Candidatus Magnetomorum sp. HK-1]